MDIKVDVTAGGKSINLGLSGTNKLSSLKVS